MPPDAALIEARGLTRAFGSLRALRGVDLAVRRGEALAVAGPNGAGKTTLLRLLAGLMRPTSGEVRLADGRSPRDHDARRQVGFLSHQSLLYDDLTPLENLRFTARLHRLADGEARARRALDAAGLTVRGGDPVRQLSRGMVQRVAIARALLHDPPLLLLDEPFTGLDADSAARLRAALAAALAEGRAVVLVTHQLAEAWDVATHVGYLARGRWAELGPRTAGPDEFLSRHRGRADG